MLSQGMFFLYLFMIQYSLIVLNVTTARFMVQMTYLKTKKITTHKRFKKKGDIRVFYHSSQS